MMVYYWLLVVFILGTVVGSFLNVCIARLPVEKSILWPGSRCGSCVQAIRWYDNLPILSYLWLRGCCRNCGAKFSPRYLIVELATGLGFAGLFYAEVTCNLHNWPMHGRRFEIDRGFYPLSWYFVWLYHAILFSFLMVAAACDLDGREIPLPLTLTGTLVGLIGAVLLPWPWPLAPDEALPRPLKGGQPGIEWRIPVKAAKAPRDQVDADHGLEAGVYPWPVWGPLPAWLEPGDWKLGLATGLVGALVGTMMMRGVAFLFSRGLGREALGLGDADLMMMAGAFLGWQAVVVAFFASVVPALAFGIVIMVVKRDNELPFGPSLAAGIMLTWLCWRWIGQWVQPLFFDSQILIPVAVLGAVFMLVSSYVIGLRKRGSS
jgi:leader peptidase (prepilin peptidase)/N-methyltransferase